MLDIELRVQAVKRFLNARMTCQVGDVEDGGQDGGLRRHIDTGAMEDETIHDVPRFAAVGDHQVA